MKNWLKLLLVLFVFALISVTLFFICKAFGLTDINSIRNFIESTGKYGIIIFFFIEILTMTIFCFVPILNTAMVVLGMLLFGAKVGFFISWVATFCASSILFFIGDKFGEKFATHLIGKAELEHAQDLIDNKSKLILPLVFIIPGLPDDALCIVAGMTKMKYWYFALVTLIFRGLDTAIVCFLGGNINWSALSVLDWVLVVNIVLIDIYLIYKLQKWIERKKNSK